MRRPSLRAMLMTFFGLTSVLAPAAYFFGLWTGGSAARDSNRGGADLRAPKAASPASFLRAAPVTTLADDSLARALVEEIAGLRPAPARLRAANDTIISDGISDGPPPTHAETPPAPDQQPGPASSPTGPSTRRPGLPGPPAPFSDRPGFVVPPLGPPSTTTPEPPEPPGPPDPSAPPPSIIETPAPDAATLALTGVIALWAALRRRNFSREARRRIIP